MLDQSKITNVKLSIQIIFSVEIKSQASNDYVPLFDTSTNFEAAPKFIGIIIQLIFYCHKFHKGFSVQVQRKLTSIPKYLLNTLNDIHDMAVKEPYQW